MSNAEQPIKSKSIWSKIWSKIVFRVKSRNWLMEQLTNANRILSVRTAVFAERIKELDQGKTYQLVCDSPEEAKVVKELLWAVKAQMRWTVPDIIITTRELEEVK